MQYLSLELRLLRSEEVLNATMHQVGIWLMLLNYCADQETGGIIRDGMRWRERECAMLGFSRTDLDQPCSLWKFEVGHLHVFGYSVQHERSIISKRKGGVKGSRRRWQGKVLEMPVKYEPGTE